MDAQDKDLRTPLVEAIINNHIEVARYLIQNGACVYHVVSVCAKFRPECKTEVWLLLDLKILVLDLPGGGWLYWSPSRSQVGKPRNSQYAPGNGTGGRKCSGKERCSCFHFDYVMLLNPPALSCWLLSGQRRLDSHHLGR